MTCQLLSIVQEAAYQLQFFSMKPTGLKPTPPSCPLSPYYEAFIIDPPV